MNIDTNFGYANFSLICFDKAKKNSKNIFIKLAKKVSLQEKWMFITLKIV